MLVTDLNTTCPRCGGFLEHRVEYESCLACGWIRELEVEVPAPSKPRRSFVDLPYVGRVGIYKDVPLRMKQVSGAKGIKTQGYEIKYVRAEYYCPIEMADRRCNGLMGRKRTGDRKGLTVLECNQKHVIQYRNTDGDAMWKLTME